MMNRRFLFALLAASVPLAGCSKFLEKFSRLDGGTTQVSLAAKSQHSLVSSVLTGGVMVYAIRTTDGFRQSIRLNDELSTATPVTLPNGSYRFLAVGWPSAGLTGTTKCGFNTPFEDVALSGSPISVSITMSDAACDNDLFAPSPIYRTGATFNGLRLTFCGGAVDVSGFSGSSLCDQTNESYRFFAGDNTAAGAGEAEFDPVTNRLVYIGDIHELGRKELFSVTFDGKGTVKQNSPTSVSPFDVEDFELVPGAGKVVYRANQDNTSQYELYISTIGQPGGTKISGAINGGCPSCAGVKDMMVTSSYVVFAGEMDTLERSERFTE